MPNQQRLIGPGKYLVGFLLTIGLCIVLNFDSTAQVKHKNAHVILAGILDGWFSDNTKKLLQNAELGDTGAMYKLYRYHIEALEGISAQNNREKYCHHFVASVNWVFKAADAGHRLAQDDLDFFGASPKEWLKGAGDGICFDDRPPVDEETKQAVKRILETPEMKKARKEWLKKWKGVCTNENCDQRSRNPSQALYYNPSKEKYAKCLAIFFGVQFF